MRYENETSEEITKKRGVRQGCILSPCLFNIYTDSILYERRPLSLLRKGSRSRRLWESPPIPTERYEARPCLCVFVARFDRLIFFTIRQKWIRGGSTYAKCNSGQRDPAIVSLPRLVRPGDTIDSVQLLARHHTRCTLKYTAEEDRQAGREARKERGGMGEGGREGGRGGSEVGREGGREGVREEGGMEGGREGGCEGGREGGR